MLIVAIGEIADAPPGQFAVMAPMQGVEGVEKSALHVFPEAVKLVIVLAPEQVPPQVADVGAASVV